MNPAREPRALRETARLLIVEPKLQRFRDSVVSELPDLLEPGDLLVVNDAATLPASIKATAPSGTGVEIRLLNSIGGSDWNAVVLGEGDWRTPTELRDLPQHLVARDTLRIAPDFYAQVVRVAADSDRLLTLRFSRRGSEMWSGIYAYGRPVQYSYLSRDLSLWSVQTAYASRPWAAEMPSAGQPLTWRILLELKRRGVGIVWLTHGAGLSAVGDEDLDARLPFAEQFEIPQSTIDAIEATRRSGGRVIAVGTTVVRALEGCAALHHGELVAGVGQTDLVIDRHFQRRIVDGILTGVHDPAQSHFNLLRSFADEMILRRAWRHAIEAGYLCHEFGDLCLIVNDQL